MTCSAYQSIAQIKYTTSELEAFVFIYMDQKNDQKILPVAQEYLEDLAEYGISIDRYREVFSKMILGDPLDLTESEELFFDLQKEKCKEENTRTKDYLNRACEILNLDIDTFNKIESAYNSDIKFQRSLKPFFDKYFNSRK